MVSLEVVVTTKGVKLASLEEIFVTVVPVTGNPFQEFFPNVLKASCVFNISKPTSATID